MKPVDDEVAADLADFVSATSIWCAGVSAVCALIAAAAVGLGLAFLFIAVGTAFAQLARYQGA